MSLACLDRRLLVETHGPRPVEACEVPVFREQLRDAVLAADRHELCVEGEVALDAAVATGLGEDRRERGSWREEARGRATKQLIEERERRVQVGRWVKDARVRDDAHELAEAEDRKRPWYATFRQGSQPIQGDGVERGFLAVRIHEDVRVDGDHVRSSKRSYRAFRSATSIAGGRDPDRVGGANR